MQLEGAFVRLDGVTSLAAVATCLAAVVLCCGCGGCSDSTGAAGDGVDSGASKPSAGEQPEYVTAVDLVDQLPHCDADHRGVLLDLGGDALRGAYGWSLAVPQGIVSSSHQGASWARIYDRQVDLSFVTSVTSPVFVSMRAIGRDARSATVSVDGQLLGTIRLTREEVSTRSTRTTKLPLEAGIHQLRIRFRGRKQPGADPFAEVDWIRIGVPDEIERTYGAPTQADLLTPSAKLGGIPKRGIALRAPGAVRCTLRIAPEARFRSAVGMRGTGNAKVAIRVRRDGEPAKVLQWIEVKGGEDARWSDLDLPLESFEREIVSLELVASESSGTGRLLLGDPAIVVPVDAPPKVAPAKTAVVVVLDGVEPTDLPPWRQTVTPHLPTLSMLAESATVFDEHRAPSTLVSAVVASLISGLSPRQHRLSDAGAKLPESVSTLGTFARDASVRAAMFTGVPTTFEAFGFAGQWEHFKQYPPNEGRLASAPFDDAIEWIGEATATGDDAPPLLVVIHARGGHPPWELTPPEAATLPPADYTGFFGPRRAAETLANVRERRARLSDADRIRMRALFFAGLTRQDEALGKLVARLEELGRWDSSLFVITGDVSSARASLFADGGPLEEHRLHVPLYVHFPEGKHAGERVDHPTQIYDVLHTAMASLGLKPPPGTLGHDLAAVAGDVVTDWQRPRVAFVDEQYSARWGQFVLRGEEGERPTLCDLRVDPTCSFNRWRSFPIVTRGIFRRLATTLKPPARPHERTSVTMASETAAQLKVWGAY
ncbi:MAG: sulfatase-like hydrolase/transferase [Deltaproteobacteria bacterium]|nr:sulfatase-like hydrolase/transferase [Deltaproteobacteria bacterium]MBW2530084.1 sulfatase-like hydrolase/transferase [Deltaproteobacteria bacterium]